MLSYCKEYKSFYKLHGEKSLRIWNFPDILVTESTSDFCMYLIEIISYIWLFLD